MKNYFILSCAIACNAVANILIKVAMMKLSKTSNIIEMIKGAVLSPSMIAGISFFVIALGGYSYILSKLNLSIAYPIMTSVGYMIVIAASWLFLHETITWMQIAGFILILSGVWCVAQ